MKPYLQHWWKLAKPHTSGKHPHFHESWHDFKFAWEEANIPFGAAMETILETASSRPAPQMAIEKYGEDSLKALLASLCRELQRFSLAPLAIRLVIRGFSRPRARDLEAGDRNVVVDHCSAGWSQQCGPSLSGQNVTAGLCIPSEGWYNAGHNEPEHAKGMFASALYANKENIKENTSVGGCLFAHNHDRNPEVSKWARLVLVNNVIYNYAASGVKMMRSPQVVTIAGNVFAPGMDTGGDPERPWRGKAAWLYIHEPESRVFLSPDNLIGGKTYENPWEQVNARNDMSRPDVKPEPQVMAAEPPIVIPGYEVKPAREAEEWVLANVGPFPARRNPIDERVVYETKTRTGRGRDDLEDVGGWPQFAENRRELKLPENPNFVNDDGYTNIEHWLRAFADEVEGRKGPVPAADPSLGKREAERCAKGVHAQALTAEMRRIQALPKTDWTFDAAEAKRRQEGGADVPSSYGGLVGVCLLRGHGHAVLVRRGDLSGEGQLQRRAVVS